MDTTPAVLTAPDNDTLIGGAGRDTLIGGAGDDSLTGDGAGVTVDRAGSVINLVHLNTGAPGSGTTDQWLDQTAAVTMGPTALTVEMVLRLDANAPNGATVFGYGSADDTSWKWLSLRAWSDYFDFYVNNQRFDTHIPADTFTKDEATRLSISWDSATGTVKFYLNGTLFETGTVAAGAKLPANYQFWAMSGADGTIDGAIGDIRIWSTVRSNADIYQDALIAYTDAPARARLVANWQSDGTTGTLINTSSVSTVAPLTVQNVTPANPLAFETADFAGRFNDTISGGIGNDALAGGFGNDTIDGGGDTDSASFTGNKADYTISYDAATGTVTVQDSVANRDGTDRLARVETLVFADQFLSVDSVINATAGVTITGSAGNDKIDGTVTVLGQAKASALDDRIDGLAGNDTISGLAGSDTLRGGDGNDSLDGGLGADSLSGGSGNDTYVVDSVFDVIDETNGSGGDAGGIDLVNAAVTATLATFVENLTLTGTASIGGAGNALANKIMGNAGANALSGLDGNDTLLAGAGNDALSGGAGNDSLDGSTGIDSMAGGAGNDTYLVDIIGDMVDETISSGGDAGGIDVVYSGITYTLGAFVENLTLTGTAGTGGTGNALANTITGNSGANLIAGLDGNDVLLGGSGNDTLRGGDGADRLDGGIGADTMAGGTGNDSYTVDAIGDVIDEGDGLGGDAGGIDRVTATISYTLGALVEYLTLGGTAAINGTGNESANGLFGNTGNNLLAGLGGADTLSGGTGNDTLLGGTGADNLDGGAGADSLAGGAGNDTYTVDSIADIVSEGDGLGGDAGGVDLVNASTTVTLAAFVENLMLTGTTAISGIGNGSDNKITGNIAANQFTGLDGNDTLLGGAGNDTVLGGAGNDSIDGGLGADSMSGGAGNDTYMVDDSGDVTDDGTAGVDAGGVDIVFATATTTLGAYIENLTLNGSAVINGTGNAQDNAIVGNAAANVLSGAGGHDTLAGLGGNDLLNGGAGNDRLDGGAGADTMTGGSGNDTYVVDVLTDVVDETVGGSGDAGGIDDVFASVTWTLGTNVERLTLTGSGSVNGNGNALANSITGNLGANILFEADGADTLLGGGGNDKLDGGTGIDSLAGGAGNDTYTVDDSADTIDETDGLGGDAGSVDVVNASVSYVLASYVETLNLTGTSDINATGNASANTLNGNTGANVLSGGDGNDTIVGGIGNDTLIGGSGNDTLTGGAGLDVFKFDLAALSLGTDKIMDFSVADDAVQLDRTAFAAVTADLSGVLLASNFIKGAAATTADQHIVYVAATGALLYDADGNGAGAAKQFATIGTNLSLTAADFLIV